MFKFLRNVGNRLQVAQLHRREPSHLTYVESLCSYLLWNNLN
jgi:hypothetical protein